MARGNRRQALAAARDDMPIARARKRRRRQLIIGGLFN